MGYVPSSFLLGISPSLSGLSLFLLIDVDAAGSAPGPLLFIPCIRELVSQSGFLVGLWGLQEPSPLYYIQNAFLCVPARVTLWDFSGKRIPKGSRSSVLPLS